MGLGFVFPLKRITYHILRPHPLNVDISFQSDKTHPSNFVV